MTSPINRPVLCFQARPHSDETASHHMGKLHRSVFIDAIPVKEIYVSIYAPMCHTSSLSTRSTYSVSLFEHVPDRSAGQRVKIQLVTY